MEIQQKALNCGKEQQFVSKSKIYGCFQLLETIEFLPFLSKKDSTTLIFKSTEETKRQKQFKFEKIFHLQDKIKYVLHDDIVSIVHGLLRGENQGLFISGNEENKKQKILIGSSQNSGLLLEIISQIFETCYKQEIEDQVTLKISCCMFKDNKFTDVFGGMDQEFTINLKQHEANASFDPQSFNSTAKDPQSKSAYDEECSSEHYKINGNLYCSDPYEKFYLLGLPEIMLRNMKTALKIISLISKKLSHLHEQHEHFTQNLIYTLKLEIDSAFDKNDQPIQYVISKLYLIKFANLNNLAAINTHQPQNQLNINPHNRNTVSKNYQWYVNLMNYLQEDILSYQTTDSNKHKHHLKQLPSNHHNSHLQDLFNAHNGNAHNGNAQNTDLFTKFLRQVIFQNQNLSQLYVFNLINNKLTSNQCLNQIKFLQYIQNYMKKKYHKNLPSSTSKVVKLNVNSIQQTKKQLQKQFISLCQNKKLLLNGLSSKDDKNIENLQINNIKNDYKQLIKQQSDLFVLYNIFFSSFERSEHLANLVQYQYANILTSLCDKLSKYITNEQIEDFFYCKKIELLTSEELKQNLKGLYSNKIEIYESYNKIQWKYVRIEQEVGKLKQNNAKNAEITKKIKQLANHHQQQTILLQKLYSIYQTSVFHYLYQNNQEFINYLKGIADQIHSNQTQNINAIKFKFQDIIRDMQNKFNINDQKCKDLCQKSKSASQQVMGMEEHFLQNKEKITSENKKQSISKLNPTNINHMLSGGSKQFIRKRKATDEMEKMFTNKNVCLGKSKTNTKLKN